MMDENEVWVNADVAARLGLKSGDRVRLSNQDGVVSNRVKRAATERIRPDCVYMVHGFGHTAGGLRGAYGKGASDAAAHHAIRGRSADGRHRHERQLRHHRGGSLSHGALRHGHRHAARASGAWTASSRARPRTTSPRASTATGSATRRAGHVPDRAAWRSARSAATTATQPPCVTCCPTGASHVDAFGQGRAGDHEKCIGCKACIASCPYDARFVHPEGYADKCTFCIHRVREGLDPACVAVCPTHCMHFGDLDDPRAVRR